MSISGSFPTSPDTAGSFKTRPDTARLEVTKLMEAENHQGCQSRLLWKNLTPPQAQLQVWFILQERLNSKGRLFKFCFPGIEDDHCIFCKEESETVEHVIFNCKFSNGLWYHCCSLWNLSFCLPRDPTLCFPSWMSAPFSKFDKKLWISLFYVISWSVWWFRNMIIFHEFELN